MDKKTIKTFLKMLGITELRDNDKWINCSCPLAPLRHEKSTDNNPSFGISISADRPSVFKCFSCTYDPQPIERLIQLIGQTRGQFPNRLLKFYLLNETWGQSHRDMVYVPPDVWSMPVGRPKRPKTKTLPSVVLEDYPLLRKHRGRFRTELIRYMRGRGIGANLLFDHGLRVDDYSRAAVFPLVDSKGNTLVLRVRHIDSKKCYTVGPKMVGLPANSLPKLSIEGPWFGLDTVKWEEAVIIVEGEMDCLRLKQLGMTNVIAGGGTSITDAQIGNLHGGTFVFGLDTDKAGIRATYRLLKRIQKESAIMVADWSVVGVRDAGDLKTRKQLKKVWSKLMTPNQFLDKNELI